MKKILTMAIMFCMANATFAQTSRSAFIHLKSGEVKELEYNDIDSITFGPTVALDLDMQAAYTSNIYYGSGNYMLQFSDGPISTDGLPTLVGQTLVRVYAFGTPSADSNNAGLPAGRYAIADEIAIGNLYNASAGYTCYVKCTGTDADGNLDGYTAEFTSGALNVSYDADGTATVTFKAEVVDYGADGEALGILHNLKVSYTGKMAYDNQDPASYQLLSEDINFVPTGLSGGYDNVAGAYGSYTLTYYNFELDNDGFVISAGEMVNFELLTEEATPMDVSKLAGEYTVTSASVGPWAPGNFLAGEMYEMYGWYIPMGTYYQVFGDGGSETRLKGFIKDGTVKVTVDGDNVTMAADMTAEGGHKVTMNYTTSASNIVDRASMARQKPATGVQLGKMRPAGRKSINDRQNTIKLIKRV